MNKDEFESGKLPIEFQCKTTSSGMNYHKVLGEMPGKDMRCILHQYTQKSNKGKFIEKGKYAVLPLEDFIILLNKAFKCIQ